MPTQRRITGIAAQSNSNCLSRGGSAGSWFGYARYGGTAPLRALYRQRSDEMIGRPTRAFTASHFAWFAVVFVTATLLLSFRIGFMHGLDHTVSDGVWGRLIFGIGAAITEEKGDGAGYVITPTVRDALMNGGITDDKAVLDSLGSRFPENFADAGLINRAIGAALKSQPDHRIMPVIHDDIGNVDFTRLAFRLFGHRVLSFYLTYFVISALGIATFLVAFRDRPVALALLAIVAAGELLLFVSDFYARSENFVGSVTDPRCMSVLAVVPGLYIGLLAWEQRPLSWPKGVGLLIQAAILVFVYSIRASVIWMVAAIALMIGAALLFVLVRSTRARVFTSIAAGITIVFSLAFIYSTRAPGIWVMIGAAALMGGMACVAFINRKPPVVFNALSAGFVLVLAFSAHSIFMSYALNPLYQRLGVMPSHPIWHSAIVTVSECPGWQNKYEAVYHARFDNLPSVLVNKYLEHHPAPADLIFNGGTYNGTPLTDFGYEIYTRLAFMDLVANDPKFVLGCELFDRPSAFVHGLIGHLATLWQPSAPAFWLAIIAPVIIGLYFAGASASRRRAITVGALVVMVSFGLASAPNLAVDVNRDTMIDATLMLICSIGALAAMLICWTLYFVLGLWRADEPKLAPAALPLQ